MATASGPVACDDAAAVDKDDGDKPDLTDISDAPLAAEDDGSQGDDVSPIVADDFADASLDVTDVDNGGTSRQAMLEYYKGQRICDNEAWETMLASLQAPWQVTARLTASVGWCRHTVAAVPKARPLAWFPQEGALLLGAAKDLQPEVDKALHATVILMQKTGELLTQELASMLPPLLLDVSPEHRVLDLCAAPGSKTLQLLDKMHSGIPFGQAPSGLLVANDVDAKRMQRLIDRTRSLPRGPLVCTCVPAQKFPALLTADRGHHRFATWTKPSQREPEGQFKMKFDRVLCDVPCSSDGGIRKGVRRAWSAADALALHVKQVGILQRGLELLAVDGTLVYSTCSLNPIEDEAVVAAVLAALGPDAGVEILDCSQTLAVVPHSVGLNSWRVPHPEYGYLDWSSSPKLGTTDGFYDKLADVPALLRGGKIRATMFPPSGGDTTSAWIRAQLQRCVRVLPSDSTGGFFLALFKRSSTTSNRLPAEAASAEGSMKPDGVQEGEEEQQEDPLDGGERILAAGCHVTVRASGAPAVVIGPGVGAYRGLIKIRYPDRSTYHVQMADLELANSTGGTLDDSCQRRANAAAAANGREQPKAARRPGARLFRPLGATSANLASAAAFYGLYFDESAALTAKVDVFPANQVCFRPRDKKTLYLVSAALLNLRVPRGVWPNSCAMPLFRLIEGDEERIRYGTDCPLRPCHEAAPVLARCASKRRLLMHSGVFAELLRTKSMSLEVLVTFESEGRLAGLPSCRRDESVIVPGPVVVVLSVSRDEDGTARNQADVALICTLRDGGLEVSIERDICLRLIAIADEVSRSTSQEKL